jgi:hypothetical protein
MMKRTDPNAKGRILGKPDENLHMPHFGSNWISILKTNVLGETIHTKV